jgi:hypothetical protein
MEELYRGEKLDANNADKKGKAPSDWIKETQFYIFGFVYMFARIGINTAATITPFYL